MKNGVTNHLIRLVDMGVRLKTGDRLQAKTCAEDYGIHKRTFARDMNLLSLILPITHDGKRWGLMNDARKGFNSQPTQG